MELQGTIKQISQDWSSGNFLLTIEMERCPHTIQKYVDKTLDIGIKQHREKRSLNANAYAWVLMQKMAEKLKSDKETVYLDMLRRYSRVFTHVLIRPEAVEAFRREFSRETRVIEDLGTVVVNGTVSTQLRCYFGSSSFDTKQMSVFLDGIVSECKQLEIETLPPEELRRMKGEWGT